MLKPIVFFSLVTTLFTNAAAASSAVEKALTATTAYTIAGTFGTHDFADAEEAFDWAFTTPDGISYQLQGSAPTENDPFGWKRVGITAPAPKWYMFKLGADIDTDGSERFDWVLAYADSDNPALYKLEGVSPSGNFSYSQPLNITYTVDAPLLYPHAPASGAAVLPGAALFSTHCARCHKEDATGAAGPNIVGLGQKDIVWALENEAAMRPLQGIIDEEKQLLIADFLQALKTDQSATDTESMKIDLGRALFFDPNLSMRRSMACATCHDPNRAFTDARHLDANSTNTVHGALSVGDDGITLGGRNAPTITYARFAPAFSPLPDGTYQGGMFHDGRAKDLKAQAKGPLLDQAEMMMPDNKSVIARILENPDHTQAMKTLFGKTVFNDDNAAFDAVAEVIAAFEKSDAFATFDSKYDRSKLPLTDPDHYVMSALESEGYALFFDASRTNCAACHATTPNRQSSRELFTNYGYENTGTPKNLEALSVRDGDTDHVDYGLGGRTDINDSAQYGKVKIPTLRNVAVTAPYMHNGVFQTLQTVLRFYAHMADETAEPLNPERAQPWSEPDVNGTIDHALLSQPQPFDAETFDALEAFLKLLTDKRYEPLLEE